MKNIVTLLFIFCILSESSTTYATDQCSSKDSFIDKFLTFKRILSETTSYKVMTKLSGTEQYLEGVYLFELVELDGSTFILNVEDEVEVKGLGFGKSMYFGVDLKNQELDFYVLNPTKGLVEEGIISFTDISTDKSCIFIGTAYDDIQAELHLIPTQNSFKIAWYKREAGELHQYSTMTFQ